jgi:predicted nucleic acid-binding protein
MDVKDLLRQFRSEPGLAFLNIIRTSSSPSTLGSIRAALVDAGVTRAAVNTKWKAVQRFLPEHPHIRRPTSTVYVWSHEPVAAELALASLARKRQVPDWLRQALTETVVAALGNTTEEANTELVTGQRRLVDEAKVLADVVGYVEELVYEGAGATTVLDWLRAQAADKSLDFIGRVGQTVSYDPRQQIAVTGNPHAQSKVTVVRPGAVWRGGDSPVLVARALVRPES